MTYDPIGPGSKAWRLADLAAHHFAEGNRNAAFCTQRRMIAEMRKCGASEPTIVRWKQDIRVNPVE